MPAFNCQVVEIDLREEAFRVGKKGFERIKKLLSQWPPAADLFDPLAGVTGRTAEEEGKGRAWDMLFAFVDENGKYLEAVVREVVPFLPLMLVSLRRRPSPAYHLPVLSQMHHSRSDTLVPPPRISATPS